MKLMWTDFDYPEITGTFLNAERASRVGNGKQSKKVWSRVQAKSGQASTAAWQRSCQGGAKPGRARERAAALVRWVKELGSGAAGKATDRPLKNEQSQEIERLKRERVKVKMERHIIKKALGYFAKVPS